LHAATIAGRKPGSCTPSPSCTYVSDGMTSDGVMEMDLLGLATVDGEGIREEAQATAYANRSVQVQKGSGK